MILTQLTTAVLVLVPVAAAQSPDRVTLKDGEVQTGRVVHENDERVVLVPARGREREIPRAEVEQVESLERSLREVLEQLDSLDPASVDGLLDLADVCDARGLAGEASLLRYRALLVDPTAERAYEGLGGRSRSRGWQLQVGRRWMDFEDVAARSGKWREALEFPTTHFLLRTDLPLEAAVHLALDLERLYLAFYDLLGGAATLRVPAEVPEVRVYLENNSFPKPSYPRDSWYEWDDNLVHVLARPEGLRELVLYEATTALLRNAFYATEGRAGTLPAWALAGLSEVFGAAVEGPPKATRLEVGKPARELYMRHSEGTRDVDLNRVLVASASELYAGTIGPRIQSRAYTLTDFLLFAEDGAHRPGFLAYLSSAFSGQGSKTHLAQALEGDIEEIEQAWEAHVEKVAESL